MYGYPSFGILKINNDFIETEVFGACAKGTKTSNNDTMKMLDMIVMEVDYP